MMVEGFWSRWLAGLMKQEDEKVKSFLLMKPSFSPPSVPIEVDFNQSEIDDLRTSVQSDLTQHLGYEIELQDDGGPDGTDVCFRIMGAVYLSDGDEQFYRESFWRHQRRIVRAKGLHDHPAGGGDCVWPLSDLGPT